MSLGHRVVIVSRDDALAETVFGEWAVEVLASPRRSTRGSGVSGGASIFAHVLLSSGFDDADGLLANCRQWQSIFDRVTPDAVLFDHCPTGLVAARGYSFAKATTGTGFCCPPDDDVVPNWRPWLNQSADALIAAENAVLSNVNHCLSADELKPIENIGQIYSDVDRCFLQTYRELDHFPNRVDGDYRGIAPQQGGLEPGWPDAPGTRIFAYLKKSRFLIPIVQQIAELGQPTILFSTAIENELARQYRTQYPHLKVLSKPLNLNWVQSQCDMAVHHGTHAVTASFLLAGIPAAMFPIAMEQRITCVRVHQMGAGRMGNPTSVDDLARTLQDVCQNDSYRVAAQNFAATYASWDQEDQLQKMIRQIADMASR